MIISSSTYVEIFAYFVYIYLILYHFIHFKKLTYPILFFFFLIIFFGTISMFTIWECKTSFFFNYGYIISFLYSIWCIFFLYFINMIYKKHKNNIFYILFLLVIPVFYYFMVKIIQIIYSCNTSFLKTYSASLYFLVIFIMLMPIIYKYF